MLLVTTSGTATLFFEHIYLTVSTMLTGNMFSGNTIEMRWFEFYCFPCWIKAVLWYVTVVRGFKIRQNWFDLSLFSTHFIYFDLLLWVWNMTLTVFNQEVRTLSAIPLFDIAFHVVIVACSVMSKWILCCYQYPVYNLLMSNFQPF